ncbi:MAG: mobile mystery protein B [Alphaproteobacteria bacterium]|nr:mobile mystery protein B [Alphaproteobacteria bacterium]
MKFIYPYGATPIDGDESEALIPKHITLQTELNEWEQTNILEAGKWSFGQKHADILSIEFLQKLHTKMFSETWRWAGKFRKTLKNIGVPPYEISQELFKLCSDVQFQIDQAVYSFDEVAARLHHRLVWIHPFPNGNGRHARIYTDIFLVYYQHQRFTWGSKDLTTPSKTRKKYIEALREADKYNFAPLLEFVRT